MGASIRAAASTQPFGNLEALCMKRFLISISVGTSITLIPAIVTAFVFNHPDVNSVFAFALYGPSMLIQRLGLGPDCVNANSISEKLGCMRFGFVVDLIVYPLVICGSSLMVYFILFRRERRIRLSQVN